jgi:hypothetical protein
MPEARWLVVIQSDQAALQPRLRANFDRVLVEVVVDRRRVERRRETQPTGADRRRRDRRQPVNPRYVLHQEQPGFRIYQAIGRIAARCVACGAAVEWEMPEFREPPARLSIDVLHRTRVSRETLRAPGALDDQGARHSVALQAFTATGRQLLSCYVPARPPEAFDASEELRWEN